MTAANGDLLYTEVLKKEKSNYLRGLNRLRIQSRMNLIIFLSFVASQCLSYFNLVYFQYMYFCALSRIADSD